MLRSPNPHPTARGDTPYISSLPQNSPELIVFKHRPLVSKPLTFGPLPTQPPTPCLRAYYLRRGTTAARTRSPNWLMGSRICLAKTLCCGRRCLPSQPCQTLHACCACLASESFTAPFVWLACTYMLRPTQMFILSRHTPTPPPPRLHPTATL